MKKALSALFVIFIASSPAFAFGWGDCPHSKKGVTDEAPSEKIEDKAESSNK